MKMKSIVFMSIISFAALSCNLQYLGPDNALEEASKINFFVYQIHLPAANNGGPFQCPVIYDAINRSGGSRLGIRGIIDKNTIVSIANCLRQKPDTHVFYMQKMLFLAEMIKDGLIQVL